MANKTTVALTKEQYEEIIHYILTGTMYTRPNRAVATALVLEANLGLRLGDVLALRQKDIINEMGHWRLNIREQKTGKVRAFTVPETVYDFIKSFCDDMGIKKEERMFPFGERNVQLILQKVCYYLDLENVSTHSFRKFFATNAYLRSGRDIHITQILLQHSSMAITQRYLGQNSAELNEILIGITNLPTI